MAHFYLDETLAAQLAANDAGAGGVLVHLTGQDARHAVTVARVRAGESLRVGDGSGLVVHGVVESAEPADLALRVDRVENYERPQPSIHLVQALAKGDRDELAVQAATELGVDGVIPWQATRSVARWDQTKAVKGRDRWQQIVREASKQAMRPWVPHVEVLSTTAALVQRAADSTVLVLDPQADRALTSLTAPELGHRPILLIVGPEGGIAPEELTAFAAAGSVGVRLGSTVLRTSTAGPAAIAVLSAALGRW